MRNFSPRSARIGLPSSHLLLIARAPLVDGGAGILNVNLIEFNLKIILMFSAEAAAAEGQFIISKLEAFFSAIEQTESSVSI
jgi:hypothetical protein